MKLAVAAVLLAGCGRFGFDVLGDDGDDGVEDARADTSLPGVDANLGPCTEGDARVEYNGSCYSRFDGPRTFYQATIACGSIGGHLMTITDANEDAVVAQIVTFDAWIGLTDVVTESVYAWTTGEALAYTNWAAGEPNDITGEDCVEVYSAGTFNDEACTLSQPYVCERSLTTSLPCDRGAARVEKDGRCYFRIDGAADYEMAQLRCAASAAHLVTITSQEESDVIEPINALPAVIGLTDLMFEGNHVWDTGEPVSYTRWATGEPNDELDEDCVEASAAGRWNDVTCSVATDEPICERP